MYPVSNAFLEAVKANTRKYYWTGRITTKGGAVYDFDQDDMVRGSGYITSQCCGSTEIELGTVYAAEMGISLFSDIDRYTLEDAKVELFYHLQVAGGSYERIPMGIFEVSEANRKLRTLEIKAYDYMVRFEKDFSAFESVGNCYDFMDLCSRSCGVELAQKREEIEALQNADLNLSICQDNDIETYRDVLYYIGQLLGGFFFIDRGGKLELKQYGDEAVLEIRQDQRFSSSVSDFVTRYTAVSSTNLVTEYAEYYHLDPDDGLTMNLGANPFLQYGLEVTREEICMNILDALSVISYVPFDLEFTGNPALDIGDVVTLRGGQMGNDGTIGCITSRTLKIGGKDRLQGVGKNPRLSAAKSKNDKNITGILNKVDSATIQFVLYINAKEAVLGSASKIVEQINFAVKKVNTVEYQGQILVDVTPDEGEETVNCSVVFWIDGENVSMHMPVETWGAGRHILSLYHPIQNVAEGIVHEFRVYLSLDGGSGTVAVGDALGCIRGFGIAEAAIPWDGTVVIEEMADGFIAIGGTMPVDDIRESVTMAVEVPDGIGIPERFGKIAVGAFPISFEDE